MDTWPRRAVLSAFPAALLAGPALAGCSSSSGSGPDELSFLMWGDGTEAQKAYEDVIAAYQDQNPGVTINAEFVNTNDYDTVLKTRLAGGAGPDIYGFDQKNLAQFISDGFAADLSGAAFYDQLTADAREEAHRGSPDEEAAYYVPISQSGNGIVYNTDLFARAGITEEPTTYSGFREACQKLLDAGITPLAMSAQDNWWPQFVVYYAAAENVFSQNPDINEQLMAGEATFSGTPGWARSLDIVEELVPYYMPNPLGTNQTAAQAAFLQGTAAMFPAPWILPNAREAELPVGYMNFPTTDEPVTPMWGSYLVSFGINPTNDRQQAAEQFLDFFFEEVVYTGFLGKVKAFPTREGIDVSALDPLYPDMQAAWEGRTFVSLVTPPNPGIQEPLLGGMQDLIAGRASTQEVLQRLDRAMEDVLAQQ
ncbi:ABC transporter substrate-binding protein [Kineococcus esterisolvens]|uniref:ABC transporter substrate-binding protein n=1 Tax=unclassified Kineococcus TaxID=2621656 RepID=UPI003D7E1476